MASAHERVADLLDRWSASLERHVRYLGLTDAEYAKVETWPPHQRPTRWVVDLARQRLLELRSQLTQRGAAADAGFAEALEQMSFLTGLLGAEHLERFIPLATGKTPDRTSVTGTVEQPRPPRLSKPKAAAAVATGAAGARKKVDPPARGAARATTAPPAHRMPPPSVVDPRAAQVVADAVRMLEWGREWPTIAGLIARMADRPSEAEVWKILRAHRAEIMSRARRPAD